MCRSVLSDGRISGAAVAGRNAAVSLDFRGVGTVICREVVPSFDRAVSILEGEVVGCGEGKESGE